MTYNLAHNIKGGLSMQNASKIVLTQGKNYIALKDKHIEYIEIEGLKVYNSNYKKNSNH